MAPSKIPKPVFNAFGSTNTGTNINTSATKDSNVSSFRISRVNELQQGHQRRSTKQTFIHSNSEQLPKQPRQQHQDQDQQHSQLLREAGHHQQTENEVSGQRQRYSLDPSLSHSTNDGSHRNHPEPHLQSMRETWCRTRSLSDSASMTNSLPTTTINTTATSTSTPFASSDPSNSSFPAPLSLFLSPLPASTSGPGTTSIAARRELSRRMRSEFLATGSGCSRSSSSSSSSSAVSSHLGFEGSSGHNSPSELQIRRDSNRAVFQDIGTANDSYNNSDSVIDEGEQPTLAHKAVASPTTPVPGSFIFLDTMVMADQGGGYAGGRTEAMGGMTVSTEGERTTTDSDLRATATMPTTTATASQENGQGISPAPATARKCQSTHVYFLDHYIDLLSYLKSRQERLQGFKKDAVRQNLSAEEADRAWADFCAHERTRLRQRRTRTQAIQFQILTQVGQGGFGEVFLARKVDTNELCALKRMSKKHLHLQDEVQHILTERDVLTATKSEWHVKLLYSFQDPQYVYLAMEFVQGGDLRTMLTARGVLREEDTKLYFAEMVLAIDALHQQGYLHRDLKPENFLIDGTGHVKLTDFGLSKGQLAESRIEAMKQKLKEVKNSMEPALPTLLRRGGSSMMMHPVNHYPHQLQNGLGGGGGLEANMGMAVGMGGAGMRLGGAGDSFASLNGILHRSPSHMMWNGSSSNLIPLTNTSLMNLQSGTPQQQQQHQQQRTGMREYKNEGIRRAFSIVGSADYMAPEILANKGYDYGVDYWSLGCILFEFLSGYSPFQAEDTRQTCVNVWHWRKVLQRPVYDTEENLEFNLTDEAWDLITRLIADRDERFTSVQQLKEHPWLAGLDWSNLRSQPASFVPVLSTPMDTSYFDDFSNPEDMVGYKDVMLRQTQVQEAEAEATAAAAAAAASATIVMRDSSDKGAGQEVTGAGQDEDVLLEASHSYASLPQILRVQDPWKGAFVGFTFRHQH